MDGRSKRRTYALALTACASLLSLTACAAKPAELLSQPPSVTATPTPSVTESSPTPSPTPTTETPTPTPTPSATTPKPSATPTPAAQLNADQQAEFGTCLPTTVGPGSKGECVKLLQTKLSALKFYGGKATGTMDVSTINATLNYQRSRGLSAHGQVATQTWTALASGAAEVPEVIPAACKTAGIVICVDQAHRKLKWMQDGKVVKTIAIRVGGWAQNVKTKEWRLYPTANGTWKVYDKQVDPPSDTYGSGAMPYSTMFYPEMYVHYSAGFASDGYTRSSHGCVNVGSLTDTKWVFNNTPIGTKVYTFGNGF
ncbi:MAG: L,D-transpeptidase family protein [Propionibacteriaceae bacterium]|nr:murein L,D-transpeptidase [Micropruina sp.]